jgi:hypothetical protein
MKTSESIIKISPALLQAQKALTFASKNAKNPHFKNTYADLSAVIDAVKPALNDAGIIFLQTPSPSDNGYLFLTTRLIHESGEWIEDTATCPLPKQDPQGYGSCLTYLRRYSLAAICGLYQDDDDAEATRIPAVSITVMNKYKQDIASCTDMDVLKALWQQALTLCGSDFNAKKVINDSVKARKAELEGLENANQI